MNSSSRLVLIEQLLDKALATPVEKPNHRKGVNITLACDPCVSLCSIARRLNVRGDSAVFEEEAASQDGLAYLSRFSSFEIIRPIGPQAFINLKATRRLHRSANPREILAFVEAFPKVVRRGPIICLCPGRLIMSHKTGYPAMVVFESRGDGLFARVDFDSTEIPAGTTVVMKTSR
jgi:hypothetical protein